MKPRLHKGAPIGHRQRRDGIVQYICDCVDCSRDIVYDPAVGCFVNGRFCGREEYLRHQKYERHALARDDRCESECRLS